MIREEKCKEDVKEGKKGNNKRKMLERWRPKRNENWNVKGRKTRKEEVRVEKRKEDRDVKTI